MKPTSDEIKSAKETTEHQNLAKRKDKQTQNYLVAIEALRNCKRPHHPPLQWFSARYANISDSENDIKEWMRGRNKRFCQRDLITDSECVAGYEADFIILLGSKNVEAYMARCRGQFVHIDESSPFVQIDPKSLLENYTTRGRSTELVRGHFAHSDENQSLIRRISESSN